MSTVIEMKGERQDFKEEVETTDMALLFVPLTNQCMIGIGRESSMP